ITLSTSDVVKTYDGTLSANGLATVTAGQLFGTDALSGGTFAFTDRNAGTNKTVTVSGVTVDDGNGGNNYVVTYVNNTTSTITPASITAITGITAANKVYDGTTAASLDTTNAGFTGLIAGDQLTVATASGAFADRNVGIDKLVAITGLALRGADAANYALAATTATTTADITPASLTLNGFSAADRIYDGSTSATIVDAGTLAGIIGGDSVGFTYSGATFFDKHAGIDKPVTLNDFTLTGADAGNYMWSGGAPATTATITPATISSITGISASDKVYDGTTVATLDTSGAVFTGLLAGDELSIASATGA